MDSGLNPLRHLDLAAQHYFMQVLGWMWSMVFSLSFLSIFQFGYMWGAHALLIAGVCMTVALFREAEKIRPVDRACAQQLSASSPCIWKLDNEA